MIVNPAKAGIQEAPAGSRPSPKWRIGYQAIRETLD